MWLFAVFLVIIRNLPPLLDVSVRYFTVEKSYCDPAPLLYGFLRRVKTLKVCFRPCMGGP